jgi:plastocyanin
MTMARMFALLGVVAMMTTSTLAGTTITVPTDVPTLALALNPAVSGLQAGDTIVLTNSAVYFDSYTVTTPDITIRAAEGQTIEVNPFGVGSAFTVNVGNGSFTIEGLTIRNGNNDIGAGGNGGAINVLNAGELNLFNCDFIDNRASFGGAVYALNCEVTVEDCLFDGNESANFAGAIRTGGSGVLRVANSIFENNRALGGNGGAIDHFGGPSTVEIRDSMFTANTSTLGAGAVSVNQASSVIVERTQFFDNVAIGTASQDTGGLLATNCSNILVRDCSFERNLCAGSGGALRFSSSGGSVIECRFIDNQASSGGAFQAVGSGALARIYNSVFQGNSARRQGTDSAAGGGAIVVNGSGARVDVYNSLFATNTAVTGGAITAFDAGILNVYNSTMVGNDADAIGGAIRRSSTTASVVINNSIFTGNLPTASQVAIGGQGTDEVFFSIVEGGYTGSGAGNLDADPMFVDSSNGDYRLMPGSPAVDAGSTIRYVNGPLSDLVGGARVLDDPNTPDTGEVILGATIDIGAYEFQVGGPADTCTPGG